jgi:hypothetical protein
MYVIVTDEEQTQATSREEALFAATGDSTSVLRSMVDICERLHTKWRGSLGELEVPKARKANYNVIPMASVPCELLAHLQACYHMNTTYPIIAYSRKSEIDRCAADDLEESRRYAKEFGRLLNLTSSIVTKGLEDAKNADIEVQFRIERTEWLVTLTDVAVARLYFPYGREYGRIDAMNHYESARHPDAAKWLRINARVKRAMKDLWLEWAQDDEWMANNLPSFPHHESPALRSATTTKRKPKSKSKSK